ncbi:1-phosphofructokinase family hexose kinase [Amphiplicatus metriothermophilus]|uniref:Phosphofructokinase n=1 Tax=Amphiplicatus metriothermophilus TaxID=1519374 RepID=A0A239Q0R1_9PROT|nr:hexose kinase [Amphiplicatus metriothermophilus]MBB5520029.1 6-phosphofructokinase 2 [Amphiplicatus metriothermophilus]SNT75782.1 6-phosphofructokinase [Amphiplicatus metriothermophilus]
MPRIITLTPNPTYDFAVDADFVAPNRKLRCRNPQSHPGGGGVNVARAAVRLRADVLAIITAGGLYGDAVKGLLGEETVPIRSIPVRGETRIAFHVRDLSDGQEYRFNLPGAEMSAAEADAMIAAVEEEAKEGDYVVGSGSLPGGGPVDLWARAARAAKARGARFVLDSIHGVHEALAEGIFMLRHNRYEYPIIAGRELPWPDGVIAFARGLVAEGKAERVTITHGADGSIMASKNGVARTNVLPIKAHSAVGAGDSYVAALLVALMRGWSDDDAIRYAMAAAGATRLTPGTALFRPEDVERLYKEARGSA